MGRTILRTVEGVASVGLLTDAGANAKLRKHPDGVGAFMLAGLSLVPADTVGGVTACTHASPGCAVACLHATGRGEGVSGAPLRVRQARERRMRSFLNDPARFLAVLVDALERHELAAIAAGAIPAVRLNMVSDLPWYRIPVRRGDGWHANVFAAFPSVQFWDYTKSAAILLASHGIANHHVTFSLSESNDRAALRVLDRGGAVAVVVRGGYAALPVGPDGGRSWGGVRAVDGDAHDLRWLDPAGPLVVALGVKGLRNRADATDAGGFFRPASGGFDPERVATFHARPGMTSAGAIIRRAAVAASQDESAPVDVG
jgi:hypothetical protein